MGRSLTLPDTDIQLEDSNSVQPVFLRTYYVYQTDLIIVKKSKRENRSFINVDDK